MMRQLHEESVISDKRKVLFLLSVVATVHCFSTGAPATACANIYPVGHSGPSQSLSTNPFLLSLSDFDETYGGEFYYVSGQQYTLTLSGSGGEEFRGFLAQARTVADGSPVGVFTDNGNNQKLSSCTPMESALTHGNSDLKSSVTMDWTAPLEGPNEIVFLFAVVVENSINASIFYAPVKSANIKSCSLPLYESSSRCVETCPSGQFGNGSAITLTGICQQLPADYRIALNATIYYAEISTDTPLNTPVYRIRISVNSLNTVPVDMSLRFFQTGQISHLFEFEDNTTEHRLDISVNDLQTVGNERVFDTSISLVADPASQFSEDDYPVHLDLIIQFVVLTDNFDSLQVLAQGLGSIQQPPDPCDDEPCQNGASCENIDNEHFNCSCLPGFTGAECETDIDTYCESRVCLNGGTCMEGYGDETRCNCTRGFTGDSCAEDDPNKMFCENNTNTCENGGTCVEAYGNETNCNCTRGFMGESCTEDDPYEMFCDDNTNMCRNGGTCIERFGPETSCNCTRGYTGEPCDEDDPSELFCEDDICANGGTCNEERGPETSCSCIRGYAGDSCTEDDPSELFCNDNFCANGGTCTEEYGPETNCTCVRGFNGDSCEEDDPSETFCGGDSCENEGTCVEDFGNSTTCLCTHGYTGPTCRIDLSSCLSDTCMNGGSCTEDDGSDISCSCASGFTGMFCETDIDTYCEMCKPCDGNTQAIIGGLIAVIVLLSLVAVSGFVLAAFIAKRKSRIFAVNAAKEFVMSSVTSSDAVITNHISTDEKAAEEREGSGGLSTENEQTHKT